MRPRGRTDLKTRRSSPLPLSLAIRPKPSLAPPGDMAGLPYGFHIESIQIPYDVPAMYPGGCRVLGNAAKHVDPAGGGQHRKGGPKQNRTGSLALAPVVL